MHQLWVRLTCSSAALLPPPPSSLSSGVSSSSSSSSPSAAAAAAREWQLFSRTASAALRRRRHITDVTDASQRRNVAAAFIPCVQRGISVDEARRVAVVFSAAAELWDDMLSASFICTCGAEGHACACTP